MWLHSPAVLGCAFDELKGKKLLIVGFGFLGGTGSVTFLEEVVSPCEGARSSITRAPQGVGAPWRMNELVFAPVACP